ncbi:MAG: substrate-binding domain-containing protein [Treponema sp.]|nr:substrate-binding domain-containing protein [Treponema sp.]
MKRMNVAVMMLDISSEYATDVIAGITGFFEKKIDAIVCANMALGVMNKLGERGISVPDDVIVAGFDNSVQLK